MVRASEEVALAFDYADEVITLGAEPDRVLAELAAHRIDLVSVDTPMPFNVDLKACNQLNWRRFVQSRSVFDFNCSEQSRVTDQLVLSGLNPQDRAEYERSLASMSPADEGTEKVRQLHRPKPTKDSLTDAFNLQR